MTEETSPEVVEDGEVSSVENEPEIETADPEEPEEAEEIEFDFGGNKLRVQKDSVPDEVAAQLDKFTKDTWSDYTRKTQDIAERSKAVEARESVVEKLANLNGETLQAYAQGLALRGEIEQLSRINVHELWQSDPDQARQVSDLIARKQAELQTAAAKVSAGEREFEQAQKAERSRRLDEGRKLVERQIKDFNPGELVDYVIKNYGMSKDEAETWPLNPNIAVMAHKAMQFDRMQAKAKPQAKSAEPVKAMKAKGAATANADPDKMSMDEWLKWRRGQLRRK